MSDLHLSRKQLLRLVLLRFGLGFLILGAMFFIPAGTLKYWEAWAWLAALIIPMFVILVYLMRNDPALLERRMRTLIVFGVAFIIPGLDFRFGWSHVPLWLELLSLLLVEMGYVYILRVFRENSYASRVVEVSQGQKVIDTGPYAFVRHPMYLGAIVLYAATPLALGSYWALLVVWLMIPILTILRIPNEEEVLKRELPGYAEYMQKVRYRLVPGIW
jgi:protein-S-isoprenylcysteine O-methyltransferase Ste14